MQNCFCTLFDHRYLDRGLALYESIARYCNTFQFWVLCMDDSCFEVLAAMKLEHMHLITLAQLEKTDTSLKNIKESRTPIEYYFNCKPSLALYVLKQCELASQVIYMDADIYFFANPERIYRMMGEYSVAITPHRFRSDLKYSEKYGKFNAGYLLFKRNENGLACLNWWRERCIEWCNDVVEDDRFADQKYIERFASLFEGVLSIDSIGVNLAPWNIDEKKIKCENDKLYVNGERIVFYHFHNLRALTARIYNLGCEKYTPVLNKTVLLYIYKPYLAGLLRNKREFLAVTVPLKRGGKKEDCVVSGKRENVFHRILQKIKFAFVIVRGMINGKYLFAVKVP